MKKRSVVLGLILSISSVSNAAFCLKQYSRNMNRYTASSNAEAQRNNYAVAAQLIDSSESQPAPPQVRRQK